MTGHANRNAPIGAAVRNSTQWQPEGTYSIMMGKTIYLPSDRGPAAPARAPRLRLGDCQCSLPVARLPGSQAASGLVHAAVAGQDCQVPLSGPLLWPHSLAG